MCDRSDSPTWTCHQKKIERNLQWRQVRKRCHANETLLFHYLVSKVAAVDTHRTAMETRYVITQSQCDNRRDGSSENNVGHLNKPALII